VYSFFFFFREFVVLAILLQLGKFVIVLEILAQMLNFVMMVFVIAMPKVFPNLTNKILCILFSFFSREFVVLAILLQLGKFVIVLEILAQMLNSVMMVFVIAMPKVFPNLTNQILCIVFSFFFVSL
jgi:hypothetical protein